jgi:peptidoglycan hydrolase-like protein with peptidoglycan-binding domain
MLRKLALVSAVAAATLCTSALAAQSTAPAPSKPAAAPAAKPAPAIHVKVDSSWSRSQITEAQQGLAKAGLYKGKVTGSMNADTRKALRAYQKQQKLPVTGRLDNTVLTRLKSA